MVVGSDRGLRINGAVVGLALVAVLHPRTVAADTAVIEPAAGDGGPERRRASSR